MSTNSPTSIQTALLIMITGLLLPGCISNTANTSNLDQQIVNTTTSQEIDLPTPVEPTASPSPIPATSVAPPYSIWIDPILPTSLKEEYAGQDSLLITTDQDTAEITISETPSEMEGQWLYLAVAPFYSHLGDISFTDLQACWKNGGGDSISFDHLLVTQETAAGFSQLWGLPSNGCVITSQDLVDDLWYSPDSVGILPFEDADPSLTILSVDGSDPLSNDFSLSDYPLNLPYYFQADSELLSSVKSSLPLSNFSPAKLTSIALTGVTAMVRDTAVIMENKGITYPGEDVKPILAGADITHISNEVPFAVDCPTPTSSQPNLIFCSDDRYLGLMEYVGTDIVELDGDHFGDWGPEAMLHTLDLYQSEGWLTYGGGRTLSEGLAPIFITNNGNNFAFLGCNGKALDVYATATATEPGAVKCDFDWMIPEVRQLADEGYIVIVTMQHEEVNSFGSIAWQRQDFRPLVDAGATIVSGSQAHHPQGFEIKDSSFIHYGLGNLFFDQWYLAQGNPEQFGGEDKSFIDLHYFYGGRYISTRLIPLQFIDNARPRLMTEEESQELLDEVYRYSLREGQWVNLYQSGFYTNSDQ